MSKKFIQEFYKSDALIDRETLAAYLHDEFRLDWHSSKGFLQLRRDEMLDIAYELSRAYESSRVKISHIVNDGSLVSLRYSHHVRTFENPREEMLLAHFMVIWEIKDGKLYRGYQMSQLS
ncbi:MAG: nuclear transport factor 2 family protein [Flavobacterium sp.]|nr:nuclear transport factor 2 family protein [Flavobacterium sp.]